MKSELFVSLVETFFCMSELKSQLWSCVGAKLMLTADGGVSLCNPRPPLWACWSDIWCPLRLCWWRSAAGNVWWICGSLAGWCLPAASSLIRSCEPSSARTSVEETEHVNKGWCKCSYSCRNKLHQDMRRVHVENSFLLKFKENQWDWLQEARNLYLLNSFFNCLEEMNPKTEENIISEKRAIRRIYVWK